MHSIFVIADQETLSAHPIPVLAPFMMRMDAAATSSSPMAKWRGVMPEYDCMSSSGWNSSINCSRRWTFPCSTRWCNGVNPALKSWERQEKIISNYDSKEMKWWQWLIANGQQNATTNIYLLKFFMPLWLYDMKPQCLLTCTFSSKESYLASWKNMHSTLA